MKKLIIGLVAMLLLSTGAQAKKKKTEKSLTAPIAEIEKVQDYWQTNNTPYTRGFWDNAAYYTGNMEAYRLLGKADYYQYSDRWCRHNNWKGATSNDKRNWKYKTYGEGNDFVLFGDWQICFQTYIDMYNLVPEDYKVARAKEVMAYECQMEDNKFWWWADALYMVMPVMTKMYKLTGDEMYLDKLYENFLWSDSLMWDKEDQLYYRDGKYIWPKVKTSCNGGKSFWARGDGWVLAGLAKVLADMPVDYKNREIFVTRFKELAEGVARCQQADGYWSRSMLCEGDAPGPETSGTAFFCYGLEWGVNHGYLDKATYSKTIEKAWNYLSTVALQADGSVGYVQPIGEKPDPTKIVDAHSQAPFGTGAWLLAACERVRYVDGTASLETRPGAPRIAQNSKSFSVTVKNPTTDNRNDVIELEAATVYKKLSISGGRQFLVLDGDKVEVPYQITNDGKVLIQVFVRPQSSTTFTLVTGEPKAYRLDCNGRLYPNREDDLTWENDRNAWRFYGPKMHNKGVTGYDIFCKNISAPVQDQLYHNELTSYGVNESLKKQGRGSEWSQIHRDVYTYHRDKGLGMDAYTVGSTLGAGAPALMDGDDLLLPDVYETAKILENGPLRFTVSEQMYAQDKGKDKGVIEHRLLSQDRGSHLASCTVNYKGLGSDRPVAAGIVVHESAPSSYIINKEKSYVAYADPLDTPQGQNGELYIGILFPDNNAELQYLPLKETKAGGIGHVLGKTTYTPDQTFTYYFGTAWSKYDVPNMTVWQALLDGYAARMKQPLEVVME
jgi:rhamnogalacturonyl hydrolase YesR